MKLFHFLTLLLSFKICGAQNLVANESFEDTAIHFNPKTGTLPAAWFYNRKNKSAGYMEKADNIYPTTGKRMLWFTVGSRISQKRTYWETRLLSGLEKGKRYLLTINVNGWHGPFSLEDLGLYFTNKIIFSSDDTLLQPTDYVSLSGAKVKKLKNEWFGLEKEFVAAADAQYLIIGNFSSKDYQEIAKVRISSSFYIGELVDDIRIIPVEKIACEHCAAVKDSLYAASGYDSTEEDAPAPLVVAPAKPMERKVDTLVFSDILFAFGSDKLLDTKSLDGYSSVLAHKGIWRLTIVGYTDDIGSVSYNSELAKKRAIEIGRQLSSRFHVPESIMEIEGRGISTKYPDKSKNRRVEVYVNYQ